MKLLSKDEAKSICDKVMAMSKADECRINLSGSRKGNVRYANNSVSTAGQVEDTTLVISVAFGKKQGSATCNQFDAKSLEAAVRRAEEVARLAPENPEFMPAVGKQEFKATNTYSRNAEAFNPDFRADVAFESIAAAKKAGLQAAGYFNDSIGFDCIANSNGVFGFQELAGLNFTVTTRTEDGRGSGWVNRAAYDPKLFDPRAASDIAIEKALRSVDAKALEPGRYTVVMEPAATNDLLNFMFNAFDARSADEGRSFLSKKGGANRLGDKLFDEQVNIWTDPWDPNAPVLPWDGASMQARTRRDLIKNGVISSLDYNRYWAQKQGKVASPAAGNIIMAGGSKSTEEMIASTKKGILVTRTWYIRMVDPQSVALTGLTRDGTFYIENGKVKHPVKNFRFNDSPVSMLNNIDELGRPMLIGDTDARKLMIPSMKVRDFNFTSLSDAV